MWYEMVAVGIILSAGAGWFAWSRYCVATKKSEKLANALRKKRAAFAVPEVVTEKRRKSPSFGRR